MACCLSLEGSNRNTLTNQLVHERTFTNVGITNDIYEFPLSEPMCAREMAKRLGIKIETVWMYSSSAYLSKLEKRTRENKKRKDYKIVGVKLDMKEDLENE